VQANLQALCTASLHVVNSPRQVALLAHVIRQNPDVEWPRISSGEGHMTVPDLSRLERVDLREAWLSEPADFTPWLASEENLALLGEALDMELELEAQEKEVGPFRADILCTETGTGHWVLIENQLEKTDHTHLGQLLTYAAGLHAVTIVWLAATFAEEHRAALDWLNELTDDTVDFFGMEIELWRIGKSDMAPKFNVVSKPNDWSRNVRTSAAGGLTATNQLQLEYWTTLREHLSDTKSPLHMNKPLPQAWQTIRLDMKYCVLEAYGRASKHDIGVGVASYNPSIKPVFAGLEKRREDMERELGETLVWTNLPDKPSSGALVRTSGDIADRSDWPRQFEWLRVHLEGLATVFPKYAMLVAASGEAAGESAE
jgi:hypothetical protein